MKRLPLLFFVFASLLLKAQSVDYNKIIVTEQISSISFEEKLVQLAWQNHPSNKVASQRVEQAQSQQAKAQWSWLDNIYLEGNYNEFTGDEEIDPLARAFYPRYNVGIRLPLSTFVQTPLNTKIAKDQVLITEFDVNAKKLECQGRSIIGSGKIKRTIQNY